MTARGAALALGLALAACGGGRGAHAVAPALSGAPVADPASRLMSFVPADASFVFLRDQQAALADRFTDLGDLTRSLAGLRAGLHPEAGSGTAFAAALLDALARPDAARDALGWREGTSVLVLYGLGFELVARAELDGAALRATIERAAADSRFVLAPLSARGHAYYRIEIPTPAFSITLLLRVERDGAVLALGGDEDRLLDEVLADRPSGPRFDPAPALAAAYPDRRAEAHFSAAIMPARLSSALAAVVARRPPWLLPLTPCAEAGVGLLAATPAISLAWVPSPSAMQTVGLVEVDGATADRLARDLRPIPRWREGGDRLRLGVGVGPRALIDALLPWLAALDHTLQACSGNPGPLLAAALQKGLPPPVEQIDAAMVELDPRANTVTAAIAARDPQALWAGLRSFVPLRPQSPAPGEQVSAGGLTFTGGDDALGVAMGAGGVEALTALMAGGPGPREVLAIEIGRGVFDSLAMVNPALADSRFASIAFHVGVRDRRVVVAMTGELAEKAQLAH